MKKDKIMWLIIALFLISACTEDFMDKTPLGELSDNSFWLTKNDLEYAVNDIYTYFSKAQHVGGDWVSVANLPVGDIRPTEGAENIQMSNLDFKTTNPRLNTIWFACYDGIAAANRVINRAQTMDIDDTFKNQKIAEAKFLRGYYYLNLVRAYGDVPLIIDEQTLASDLYPKRTPKADVLAQMVTDFTEAASVLPVKWDDANIGRATKGAALGFMALTNLYQEKWDDAISNTEAIFALNQYALLPNYSDVYKFGNENTKESLFEAQYRDVLNGWVGNRGTLLQTFTAPRGIGLQYIAWGGWGGLYPSENVLKAFEPGDSRRGQIISPGQSFTFLQGNTYTMTEDAFPSGLALTKYWYGVLPSGNNHSPQNIIMLKYSEAILNYAEALARSNRIPDAYVQINKIRTRAGLPNKNPSASIEACIIDINKERRVENLFEQNCWYDLTRTKQAAKFVQDNYGKTLPDYKYLFPLPQSELDNNPSLIQNPDY
jgi:starch-binding outer membrane protein, SusD/RagB family